MRTENAFKIVKSNITLQVAIMVSGIILPRLILLTYGSEVNGLVSSIKQFLVYFSIAGVGIGVASLKALYKPLSEKRNDEINGILSATAIFFRKSGYIFIGLILGMLIIYPLLIKSTIPYDEILLLIVILSSGTIIEYMILNKYRILTTADQKLYVEVKINTEGIILNLVLAIILIKLHFSIVMVQFVVTLIYCFRTFFLIRYVKKNYPEINFNAKPLMEAIPDRWAAFSYQISTIIISCTPIILLTFLCGLKEVSVYAIYNIVFAALLMIINSFSSGISSSFGNLITFNNKELLLKCYSTFEFIFYNVSFVCYACAYKLILPFVSVYTQGVTDMDYHQPILALLFLLNGVSLALRTPALTLVEAAGKFKENFKLNICEAICNVILSLIFTVYFGLVGVLLGGVFTSFTRTLLYIIYVNKNILARSYQKIFSVIAANGIMISLVSILPINTTCENIYQWFFIALQVFSVSFILIVAVNSVLNKNAFKDTLLRIKFLTGNSSYE